MMGRKPSVKESVIERALREQVIARGGICEKIMVIGRRGFFDRLIVLPGPRVIFAEIKKPRGGRVSAHQRQYIDDFKARGLEVAIVRTMADIDALLKK
jgi:hypothetical protein